MTPRTFGIAASLVLVAALGIARRTGVGGIGDLAFPALVAVVVWAALVVRAGHV